MYVSGFSIRMYSPLLAQMPTLLPFANPKFFPFSITCTEGNWRRITSTDPSVDPLSDTMISKSTDCVQVKMDLRQSLITFKSFQQIMTIDNFIVVLSTFLGRFLRRFKTVGVPGQPSGHKFAPYAAEFLKTRT